MRHRAPLLALAVTLVAGLAVFAGFGGSAAAGGSTAIKVGDNFFKPTSKTVSKGTKVKFRWIGHHKHNVIKKRGPGESFASPTTRQRGVNFAKRFKKRGSYKIICTIHDKMKLSLKVD
jgi:plastocyanin